MWKPSWCIPLLLCSAAAFAQFQDSDRSELSGTIVDLPKDAICTVELTSREHLASYLSTPCEADGTFEFNDLRRGTYTIMVHVGTDSFSDQVMVMLPREQVQVQFPKFASANPGGSGTVSVAELQIPDKAKEELDKANKSLAQGDLKEAEEHVNKSLEAAPRYARAMTVQAAIMLIKKDYPSALQLLNTSAEIDASNQMTHIERAAALNALGRSHEAQLAAEQSLRLGDLWQGHLELAKALIGQKMYRQALTELNEAQGSTQNSVADLFLMRASVLFHLRDYDQAQVNLDAFEKLSPNDARIAPLQTLLNRDLSQR